MAGSGITPYTLRAAWNSPFVMVGAFMFVGSYVFGLPMNWERYYKINRFIGRDLAK
jgi:hypothetical protein